MIDIKRIYPECNADTLLIELLLKQEEPKHCQGITEVAKAMKGCTRIDKVIVGLVDDDKFKRLPSYIKEFKLIENQNGLKKHHPSANQYIIQLQPAFEKWIIAAGESCNVSFNASYYKGNFDKFKNDAKSPVVNQNDYMKEYIRKIILANPPAIQTLNSWLNEIFENEVA